MNILTKLNFNREIVLIIILASILRLWGITAGYPSIKIHVDENTIVNIALAAYPLKGVLWTSGSGFAMTYLLSFVFGCFFAIGYVLKLFHNPQDFMQMYVANPVLFAVVGRIVDFFISIGTIYLTYYYGNKVFNKRIALISSLFLAVSFIHVKESHYAKNDIMTGFFTLIVFYYSYLVSKYGKRRDYILSGIFISAAFLTKIFPILSGSMLIAAHVMYSRANKKNIISSNILISGIIFVIVSLVVTIRNLTSPGGIADIILIKNIIIDIGKLSKESPIITFAFHHLLQGIGLPLFILTLIGLLFSTIKKEFIIQFSLIIVFTVVFLGTSIIWGRYNMPRHVITLLPLVLYFPAYFVDYLFKLSNNKKTLLLYFLLLVLAVWPTYKRSIQMNIYFDGLDTRLLARSWVEQNISNDSKIVIEGSLKPYIAFGALQLELSPKKISELLKISQDKGQPTYNLEALSRKQIPSHYYDLVSTPKINVKYDIITNTEETLNDVTYYKNIGANYIATLNWAHTLVDDDSFKSSFNDEYASINTFKPDYIFASSPHDTEIDYEALDGINIFKVGKSIVGPMVTIYELKSNAKK